MTIVTATSGAVATQLGIERASIHGPMKARTNEIHKQRRLYCHGEVERRGRLVKGMNIEQMHGDPTHSPSFPSSPCMVCVLPAGRRQEVMIEQGLWLA